MRALLAFAIALAFGAHAQNAPPPFPTKNVQETFFGTVVDDPYRALEDIGNPEVAAWAKAQADYARATLDSLAGYDALRRRVAELDESAPAVVSSGRLDAKGNVFFTRRAAAENTAKLYRRGIAGAETLLVDPDDWQKQTGKLHAINYFDPSPDGTLVAFGVSPLGNEDASLYVMETATRNLIGEPIDRTRFPRVSWRPDGRSFFYMRLQERKPGMPATEKYQNGRVWLHVVGTPDSADVAVAGMDVSPRMAVRRADLPFVIAIPGSRYAIAVVANGVQRELALYTAPLVTIGKPDTPWTRICDFADKVTHWSVHGEDIYLLTYRDSPRFSIIRTRLGAPDLTQATTVVPASERVLTRLAVAKDGLYLEARDGNVKRLMRRAWGAAAARDVPAPMEGAIDIEATRPELDGAVVSLSGWTRARQLYAVNRAGQMTNTRLQPLGAYDAPQGFVTKEVKVKSHDGAMVPLSITHRADVKLDGANPTLLYGYG